MCVCVFLLDSMEYVLTDVLTDGTLTGRWTSVPGTSFVYADGTALPPALLRDPPAQNYIQEGIFLTGLILFGVAVAWTLLAILFVCVYWKHQAIKSNQPEFLLILLCGALTMAFAIVTFSFDESRGWTQDELTVACIATPWLISLGFISVYCALFSKVTLVCLFYVYMQVSNVCLLLFWRTCQTALENQQGAAVSYSGASDHIQSDGSFCGNSSVGYMSLVGMDGH